MSAKASSVAPIPGANSSPLSNTQLQPLATKANERKESTSFSLLPSVQSGVSRLFVSAFCFLLSTFLGFAGKPTAPAAPSNLAATAVSSSQINLTWKDNSSNEQGFKIQRALSATGTWTQIATVGSAGVAYSDTNLNPSTTYYYRVCSYNAKGSSSFSSVASATTFAAPPPCTFTLDQSNLSYPSDPANGSINVTASAGSCAWNASSAASWISVTPPGGTGNGAVNYSIAANTNITSRTGTLTIAGQSVTITQAGAPCTFSYSPPNASFASDAAVGTVTVTTLAGCSWTASSSAPWITITSANNLSGNGSLNYSISANTDTASRSGIITIAGQPFAVTQAGSAPAGGITNTVGYWTFDVSSVSGTTVVDNSGSGNNAMLMGNVLPTIASGKIAQAVDLDGISDCVNVPDRPSIDITGPFTVSAWVNLSALPGYSQYPNIVAKLNSPSSCYGYGIIWNSTGVSAIIGSGSPGWTLTSAAPPPAVGDWNHYVAVFDGANLKLYVNGNLYSQVAAAAPADTAGVPLKIGPHYSNPSSYGYIAGMVDDARVYNRALSDSDITQLYNFSGSGTASCTYSLSANSASFGASGGNASIGITASASGCAWTASSSAAWVRITSPNTGSGNGMVNYSVAANTSAYSQTATITIANTDNSAPQTFTVSEDGAPCSYSLLPSSFACASSATNSSFTVTVPSGCYWSAMTTYGWLHTSSTGNGNGTVTFSVDANSSAVSRSGTITIVGQTFTVTQSGVACTYSLLPSSFSCGAGTTNSSFSMTAPAGCTWAASTSYGWLHTTSSGNGNGTVSFTVDANPNTTSRTGTITADSQTFTVTQAGIACTFSLSPSAFSCSSSSTNSSFSMTAPAGCTWAASSAYGWVHTTSSGNGNGTVSFTVDANPNTTSRNGTITADSQTFTVTQAGIACSYTLSSYSGSYASGTTNTSFNITAPSGCTWAASTSYGWLHTTSSGNGNGTVSFSVDANPNTTSRSGTITADSQTFTVTQAGITCSYSLSSYSSSYGSGATNSSFGVTAPAGCTWAASTAYGWLHTTSSGNGNGTVSFSVDANPNTTSRTGTITADSQTFTVTQAGIICSFSLVPSTFSCASGATNSSFSVTTPAGCAWSASTAYGWLHTTSSGNGNGTVTFTVDANPNTTSRSGTLAAGGQTFTVNQAAAPCSYSLSSSSATFAPNAVTNSVTVTAGSGCAWSATSSDTSWLTINSGASGSGNGTITYSLTANASSSSRSSTITVAGQILTVTQNGHLFPMANPGPNQANSVATTFNFNGTSSYANDGATITSFNWNFGDLTTANGSTTSHNYALAGTYTVTLTISDSFGATGSGTTTVVATNAVVPPPSVPTGLAAAAPNCTNVNLSWNASTDVGGPGLAGYKIYRNSSFLQQVSGASWTDGSVAASTSYSYSVSAIDTAGRESSQSSPVSASTPGCGGSVPGSLRWLTNVFANGNVGGDQAIANSVAADHQGNIIVVGQFRGNINLGDGTTRSSVGGNVAWDGFIVKYTAGGKVIWVKSFGASYDDTANAVAVDSANNIIVTGQIGSGVNLGGATLTNSGGADIFVAKYSPSGAHLWSKSFGETANDWGASIALDGSDNIIVGGVVGYGPVDFGGGALSGTGQQNTVLAKLNSAGNYLWARRLPGSGIYDANVLKTLAVDRSGDVVIGGYFTGTDNFGGGAQTCVNSSGEFFLAKYSGTNNGAYLWAKVVGGTGFSGAYSLATDPSNGDIVVTGTFSSAVDFGLGVISTGGGYAIFVVRYTGSGIALWQQVYGGNLYNSDSGMAVAIDSLGRIGVTGQVQSMVNFGGGWLFGNGSPNYFALTLSSSGQYLWAKRVLPAVGNAVTFDPSLNLITVGYCGGSVDFGGGAVTLPAQGAFAVCYGP